MNSSSVSRNIRSRKKKSKVEAFLVDWTIDVSSVHQAIKNIRLKIYTLQKSLAYRSWRHKNEDVLSTDDSSVKSSVRSQTSEKILSFQKILKGSKASFFSSLTNSTLSKKVFNLQNRILDLSTSVTIKNFTLDRDYNSREKKHRLFKQIFFELIKNLKKYRKTAIYRRWINNEDQSSSRESSLVSIFNWSHLNSDFISRFKKSTSKKLKEIIEISNSFATSKNSRQKESLISVKQEISLREILLEIYFSVSIFSNHLIELDIFDRIQIFFFRDHLTRLKQTYTRNNDQSTSKKLSVEIKIEKIESSENLAAVNLEKKVARNSSSSAFFEEVKIQKSVKFFISHTFNLSRELRYSLIEFVDSSLFLIVFVWSEIQFWAFDNSIKNISDFEKNFIVVVKRSIILTNSFDNNSLDRNRIVKFITTSSSNDINHQNPTTKNENEDIKNMSFVENSSRFSAGSEVSEESQFVSKSTLFQTDIQSIAMSMFQLFIQNIQTNSSIAVQFTSRNQFRAFDIEFFDSQLNAQYELKNVVQVKKNIYYRDVFLFVKRIKNMIIILSEDVVRINLFTYFREIAQV